MYSNKQIWLQEDARIRQPDLIQKLPAGFEIETLVGKSADGSDFLEKHLFHFMKFDLVLLQLGLVARRLCLVRPVLLLIAL